MASSTPQPLRLPLGILCSSTTRPRALPPGSVPSLWTVPKHWAGGHPAGKGPLSAPQDTDVQFGHSNPTLYVCIGTQTLCAGDHNRPKFLCVCDWGDVFT